MNIILPSECPLCGAHYYFRDRSVDYVEYECGTIASYHKPENELIVTMKKNCILKSAFSDSVEESAVYFNGGEHGKRVPEKEVNCTFTKNDDEYEIKRLNDIITYKNEQIKTQSIFYWVTTGTIILGAVVFNILRWLGL